MRLENRTYGKLALIVALCIILCASLAIGTSRPFRSLALPDDGFRRASGEADTMPALDKDFEAHPTRSIDVSSLGTPLSTTIVDPSTIKSLAIAWAAGTVDVLMVDDALVDGRIRITEYVTGGSARLPQMSMREDAGHVSIDYYRAEPLSLFLGCTTWGAKHLVIELPEGAMPTLEELSLDVASGNHFISDIDARTIRATIASGKTVIENARAERVLLDIASGSASLAGVFEGIDASMASGDARIDCLGHCPDQTSVDLTSGRMSIALPEGSGFAIDLDRLSGSFACGFATKQDGNRLVHGDGAAAFSVSMVSGSFELQPSDR